MLKKIGMFLAAALILSSVSIAAPTKSATPDAGSKAKVSRSKNFLHKAMKKLSHSKKVVTAPVKK